MRHLDLFVTVWPHGVTSVIEIKRPGLYVFRPNTNLSTLHWSTSETHCILKPPFCYDVASYIFWVRCGSIVDPLCALWHLRQCGIQRAVFSVAVASCICAYICIRAVKTGCKLPSKQPSGPPLGATRWRIDAGNDLCNEIRCEVRHFAESPTVSSPL
jgi:hypothetical protein